MTKKEKAMVEALLTVAALRPTADVERDVPPPDAGSSFGALSTGWDFAGERSDWPRVCEACSSYLYHGIDSHTKTRSHGSRHLFSTKLRALRALRREIERQCAERLRKVDRMIEEEESKEGRK